MAFTAAQIAQKLNGEVIGDGSIEITGLAPAEHARPGELTFAENAAYFAAADKSQAAAILISESFGASNKVLIRVANPRVALARVLPLFFPPEQHPQGIHPSAVITSSAQVDPTAHVGPGCIIGPRAKLGARAALMANNHLSADCEVGEDSCLFPNVVLYRKTQVGRRVVIHAGTVIGSDGFGYVLDEDRHRKVLQLGNVIIGDDVEIGANSAIDRGTLGPTIIGEGTKIDNLVHIAHNVVIGRHCMIMGQVGFAGSTRLGDYVVVASQSGIADHLKIGNQAVIGAKSGVMRDIPDGGRVVGIPAAPDRQAKRQIIAAQQLPDVIHRMRELEKQVEQLAAKMEDRK
ncbi:MAG TPA: UDP-3-O-(3-hydroxymyristoyl)glucosamine N-acyltransferase [Verrucomicrobiae bacterium]|jgi:UDP-3-O-[3-hydroxymyristoyl] glucosamine N-acyltransferase|nr:UDP-3-O-(3-hydroxymyristoyl)glucosamine N-acyltransferase [Verrucomicrobiae bacterium]